VKVTVTINGRDTSIGVYSSAYLPVTLAYVDVTSNLQQKSTSWILVIVTLILISTYKTILHFYAVIIMDLTEQTPKQTSHAKQCEQRSRITVVMWSAVNVQITQTRASIVILHTRRCVDCCTSMLWLMSLQALIHVLFKTSKKRAVIGPGRKVNIGLLILELRFHFGLT